MPNNTQTAWTRIAKTILAKPEQDYETKIKPTLRSGQDKLGSLIEALGRKVRTEK